MVVVVLLWTCQNGLSLEAHERNPPEIVQSLRYALVWNRSDATQNACNHTDPRMS